MNTRIEIRPFAEADRATLRSLTVSAFEGVSIEHNIDRCLGPVAARDWCWRKVRLADQYFSGPNVETLVARDEQDIAIGYISLRFDREAKVGHIPDLVVHSDNRGQGIGRTLIEAALNRFRAEGMRIARIETLEQNPIGQRLYPALGFQEVARQIHYAQPLESKAPASGSASPS